MPPRLTLLALLLVSTAALASPPLPTPVPQPPPIPAPQERPFAGQIDLHVDATDLDRHVVRITETIPVPADQALTLLYPKWLPGNHGPTGPIASLAGLTITAGGQAVAWTRDAVDMGAFHVAVPAGAKSVQVAFDYLSPLESREGRVVLTANMLDVQWRPELLFPAGTYQRNVEVHPTLNIPAGWQYATALDTVHAEGGVIDFHPLPLDTLLDSPVYAGAYVSRLDLDPNGPVPVHLNVFADRPEDLAVSPADLAAHRNLVTQAYRTFASHHYDHYDFLFSVSAEMGNIGLEHQRSNETGAGEAYFTDPAASAPGRELLPHEYAHSWNGKFRRPADLWSPDDHVVPERDSLLWVYEGQTDYWGQVLAARSGILSAAQVRDLIALEAASLDAGTPGRTWRNLQDTTNDPIISWQHPSSWQSWSRFGDYYTEGLLIWLDADTLIREHTNNARSLNDFARAFFGVDNGVWTTETYTFDDVVHALNQVMPYDWAGFLRTRLNSHAAHAPLDGITRGGWRLAYTSQPSALQKSRDAARKVTDFTYSLGLSLGSDGTVASVLWGGPAFNAGLARGTRLVAVDGLAAETPSALSDAVTRATTKKAPLVLLLRQGKRYREVSIDYHGGLRYPHLERVAGTADRLDDVLAPLE